MDLNFKFLLIPSLSWVSYSNLDYNYVNILLGLKFNMFYNRHPSVLTAQAALF